MSSQLQVNLENILNEKTTKILPENIKKDIQIFDVVGTLEAGIDTSDATAVVSDIANGKTAYVNGEKITGTLADDDSQITLANQDNITTKIGDNYFDVRSNIGTDTIVRANNEISIRPSFEKTAEAIGLTADKIIEGNTILGIEGTGKTSEDLQEQLDNQDLIIQQLQEELAGKVGVTQNVVFDPSKIVTTSTSTSDINLLKKCIIKFNDIVLDFSGSKNTAYLFGGCANLTEIPTIINTSDVTMARYMFSYMYNVDTFPNIDLSNATDLQYLCINSTFVNFPVLDLHSANTMYNMFSGCTQLSDDSLNNIMRICINGTNLSSSNKNLKYLGLTSAQATKCQSLSNYSAFTSAGWTTGY